VGSPAIGRFLSREPFRAVWVAFGVGLSLRLAFAFLEPRTHLVGDERLWVEAGRDWVAAVRFDPLRSPLLFYPPLFPYLVATIGTFLGGLTAVKLAQTLAGALLVPAVGLAGIRLFGPRTGVLAAFFAAFYPELVWYSVHYWSEPLFMVLLWWSIERLLHADAQARLAGTLAAGLLCGLASLTRETALYFAPLAAIWLAVGRRPGALRRAGAFVLGTILVVAPWTARNWVEFHAFVPVSLMGGRALWEGNTDLPRNEVYARYDAVGGPNALIDRHRLAMHEAVRNIISRQPAWFFEKLIDQLPQFFAADNLVIVHLKRRAYGPVTPAVAWAVAGLTLLPYLAALGLFGWGLPRLPPTRPQALLLTFAAYYLLIHVAGHAFSRYRLPVVPALLLVAANAWATRKDPWPPPAPARRALAVALVVVLALCSLPALKGHVSDPLFGLADRPRVSAPAEEPSPPS
jgi:4-amino-4-deoxy-L-arabinose transferase-like glycosyltransferase